MRRIAAIGTLLALCGCSDETSPPAAPAGPCGAGALELDDGRCLPAGVQTNGCPAGELGEGSDCLAAGVPEDGCALGFEHDGDGGCRAILPDRCAPGLMALPGESRCRAVMPCGSGRWGDIATDEDTVHVDADYSGGSSDGSEAAPFVAIQAAIDAAADGALVAVAGGSYQEDLQLAGKTLRLRGRCPELVAVVGSAAGDAALLLSDANESEIGGLALTGASQGIELRDSQDVLLENLWIHDTAWRGLYASSVAAPASVLVRGSLIERVRRLGIWVQASEATLDGVVVRDVTPGDDGLYGDGVFADSLSADDPAPRVVIAGSVIERATKVGVFQGGGELVVDASVVRDTQPGAPEAIGRGIQVQENFGPAQLELTGSVLERNVQIGLSIYGSEARVERTVVRETARAEDGTGGRAINVEPIDERPSLVVEQCLLSDGFSVGLFANGADVDVRGLLVRDFEPGRADDGLGGEGIVTRSHAVHGRSLVTVTGSRIERAHAVGALFQGSDVLLDGVAVRDTRVGNFSGVGLGVEIELETGESADVIVRSSLVESAFDFGLAVAGAHVQLEATIIRDVVPSNGLFGDDIALLALDVPASATVNGSRIESSSRAGIANFGSSVELRATQLECNPIQLSAQTFEEVAPLFHDAGGNSCACAGATDVCRVLAVELEPPVPVGPVE